MVADHLYKVYILALQMRRGHALVLFSVPVEL